MTLEELDAAGIPHSGMRLKGGAEARSWCSFTRGGVKARARRGGVERVRTSNSLERSLSCSFPQVGFYAATFGVNVGIKLRWAVRAAANSPAAPDAARGSARRRGRRRRLGFAWS